MFEATNDGAVVQPADIDQFNNTELLVLDGAGAIINRIDIATATFIDQVFLNSDMSQINGIDIDSGGSFLINDAHITSTGSVVDNNFLNDAQSIATPVDAAAAIQVTVIENISVSDNVTVLLPISILVLENIAVSDNVTVSLPISILVTENIAVSDNATVSLPISILVTENIAVSDNVTVSLPISILVTENIAVSDNVTVSLPISILVTENIGVSDNVTVSLPISILVTENIGVSDNVNVSPPISILVIENIAVSDEGTLLPNISILVIENIAVQDDVTATPAVSILVLENITVADDVTVLASITILVNENITVTDTETVSVIVISPPQITRVRPISALCNNEIMAGDELAAAVTELEITFSIAMKDPAGDASLIDVSNPANYRLVSTTDPLEILPTNCADPIGANSADHTIVVHFYDAMSKTVVLGSPLAIGLAKERYQLMACYDGIQSSFGEELDGDADGTAGDDYAINFSIKAQNLLKNPNFSDGLNAWMTLGNVVSVNDDADNALLAGAASIDLSASISQCVALNGENNMRFGASLQAQLANGDSNISIDYYDSIECAGTIIDSKTIQKNTTNTVWKDIFLDTVVPSNALSLQVSVAGNIAQSPMLIDRSYVIKTSNTVFSNGFENIGPNICVQSNKYRN